ncbi:hypothetical protein GALMADRAFT_149265 [Galerina marginata CBS 339.88]|uniref:Uncharacterized protein n=1 Tax=Galerina marginata (strain CBS 339.88) TaxID=685588 RepID=A0A067S1W8_GALM3|nr:hypothetical protein GALMADRAFT_149265 [Galerina marginata CBS 339.88]
MESTKADTGSARYLDEDGKPLVCVLSRRLSPNTTDQPPTGASKPLIPYYQRYLVLKADASHGKPRPPVGAVLSAKPIWRAAISFLGFF